MSAGQHEQSHDGTGQSELARISTEMVRIYKDQFGRGPTGARSYRCGEDLLICVLEDTLTPAERNLVSLGEHERLREMRMVVQYASLEEFCEPVERITGRVVRSFVSGIDAQANGLSTETFILHPDGVELPSRRVT